MKVFVFVQHDDKVLAVQQECIQMQHHLSIIIIITIIIHKTNNKIEYLQDDCA